MKALQAPWWVLQPDRRTRELDELARCGIKFIEERALGHQLCWTLDVPIPGAPDLRVIAVFSELHPYFRPQVLPADQAFTVGRHQHPFGKHFCLLAHSEKWLSRYTLAWLLSSQLPEVLKFKHSDAADLRALEEPVGESVANYYEYEEAGCIFIDSAWAIDPAIAEGKFKLGFSDRTPLRGVVKAVYDSNEKLLAEAPRALTSLFPDETWARWVRIEEAPRLKEASDVVAMLDERFSELARHQARRDTGRLLVTAMVFRDELQQGNYSDSWVFIKRGSKPKFVRSSRAGESDFSARVPELAPMRSRTISTIGLGSLGMPSAIEFARAGVGHLKAVDFDIIEAGSTVRWPLGLSVAGMKKARVLEQFVARNYPYTRVSAFESNIGHPFNHPIGRDELVVPQLLDSDLIYEATTEWEVNHAFADMATERAIPYICISTTPGGWGGLVFRQRVGARHACWWCLQHYLSDETIETPRAKPQDGIQPAGCATMTFTGTGFDGGFIALMGVRLAISTLCGSNGGFPDVAWDCAVVQLRDEQGSVIAPCWRPYTISKHRACNGPAHRSEAVVAQASLRADGKACQPGVSA